MRKYILFFITLSICLSSFGQTSSLSATKRLIPPRFTDTTAANSGGAKQAANIIYLTATGEMAYRNTANTKWFILPTSGGGGGIGGSGATTQIPYFTASTTLAGSSEFIYNQSTGTVTLDKSQSALNSIKIKNTNVGALAQGVFIADNGSFFANYGIYGTSATPYGIVAASSAYLYATKNLALMADNASTGDIKFATGGNLEKMRLDINGALSIGSASNANTTAIVDITSTTKGVLISRMTTAQRTGISTPAEGLMVYDLTLHKLYVFDGTIWQAAW